MAKVRWVTVLKEVQKQLNKYLELKKNIPSIRKEPRSEREKEITEKDIPTTITKALSDFKVGDMVAELKKAVEYKMDKFKTKQILILLQEKFEVRVQAFSTSKKGEAYIYRKWERGEV